MLVLLLLALQVFAKDVSKTSYEIRRVDKCPEVGYFFKRDLVPNSLTPGPCFLCFCQNNGTAICWRRENNRCNVESYHRHHVGRRKARLRRSPFGLGDIFFRDATRDVLNKHTAEECKPYESSFSKDCPPVDWCVGCTVCDCDANGHWDCHLLSFCPNDKGTKNVRTRKSKKVPTVKPGNKVKPVNIPKKPPPKLKTPKITKKPSPKLNKSKVTIKPIKKSPANKRLTYKRTAKLTNANHNVKKVTPPYKNESNTSLHHEVVKKSITTKNNNVDKDDTKIVSNIANQLLERSLIHLHLNKSVTSIGDKENEQKFKDFAKHFIKQIMEAVQKKLQEEMKKIAYLGDQKVQHELLKINAMKNKKNKKRTVRKNAPKRRNYGRRKREVATENLETSSVAPQQFYSENITDSPSKFVVSTTEYPILSESLVNGNNFNLTTMIQDTTVANSEYNKYSTNNYLNGPITTQTTVFNDINRNNETFDVHFPNITITQLDNYLNNSTSPTIFHETYSNTKMIGSSTANDKSNNKTIDAKNITIIIDAENETLDDNNIEFSVRKWNYVKIHKDNGKHLQKEILFTKSIDQKYNRQIENDVPKPKVSRKEIQKKIVRKYNLRKILNVTHSIPSKDELISHDNYKTPITGRNLSDVQCMLEQILKETNTNNATVNVETKRTKSNKYKINLFKIMKTLMLKTFDRMDTPENVFVNKNYDLNKHIIDIICESMGSCKLEVGTKLWFKSKVIELNAETKNILRTIRIIKGLLQLVDIPRNYDKAARENSKFNDDALKLRIIVKSALIDNDTISDANIILIGYIKKHTEDFVKSFGKFAALLNEIISILTSNKSVTKFRTNVKKHDNLTQKYLSKFKSLILRQNLLQNTFMKKMYQVLIGIENNSSRKNMISHKATHDRYLNKTILIKDSRRLIKNLKTLKSLARSLSSSRKKRETQHDNAMDYMLTIMEYLLKHNYPFEAAPVNDGIDLLIEAIKSAPDIKLIKKKLIKNKSSTMMTITRTVKPITKIIKEENKSDYKIISKTDKLVSVYEDFKHDDAEKNVKNEFIDNLEKNTGESNTQAVYYNPVESPIADDIEKYIKSTIKPEANNKEYKEYTIETIDKPKKLEENLILDKVGNEDENMNIDKYKKPGVYGDHEKYADYVDENSNIKKNEKSVYLEGRKYEEYKADVNEMMQNTYKKLNPYKVEEATTGEEINYLTTDIRTDNYNVTSEFKKSKLKWIEDTNAKELKAHYKANNTASNPKRTTPKTAKLTKNEEKVINIPKKVEDDYKKEKPINTEEVIKQIDLQNSLEYGAEKSEFDDAGSKDGPDPEDSFSMYFV